MIRREGDEAFEDIKSTEDGVDVSVLEKFPDIDLEIWPGIIFFADDASCNLSDSISDMLLHAVVFLCVDDCEEIGFDSELNIGGQFLPNIGISCWTIVGQA